MSLLFYNQGDEHLQAGSLDEKDRSILARIRLLPKTDEESDRYEDDYKYKGEFGFDWMDVNPNNGKIEKIHGNSFSAIKHFYSFPQDETNQDAVGDIVPATWENEEELINKIKSNYPEILQVGEKYIDQPYLLMKKGQEIILSLEIEYLDEAIRGKDILRIEGNEHYTFEIEEGEKNGKIAQLSLEPKISKQDIPEEKKEKKKKKKGDENTDNIATIPPSPISTYNLKIKCIEHITNEEGENFPIKLEMENGKEIIIGGITMMQNTPLELTFRVIALISNEDNNIEKVKNTLEVFKHFEIAKHLNENYLNQAGFVIKIENQAAFDNSDNVDLNEYMYAFDKDEWQTIGLFVPDYEKGGMKMEALKKEDNNDRNIHDIVIELYYKKLESMGRSSYNQGIIVLTNYENAGNTGGFSQTIPLDHYGIFMYGTSTHKRATYAHEIGHMLGLDHTFYKEKERESLNTVKQNYKTVQEWINNTNQNDSIGYKISRIFCKKQTLLNALTKRNQVFESEKEKLKKIKREINAVNSSQINYNGKLISKEAALKDVNNKINEKDDFININKNAQQDAERILKKDFTEFSPGYEFYILREDLLIMQKEYFDHQKKIVNQVRENYIRFDESSTLNIMDYSQYRTRFSAHQIKLMRKDYENYR